MTQRILFATPRETQRGSVVATAAAGFPASNLLTPSPSEFARLTDLPNGCPIDFTLNQHSYDLVALLYATVTPHKNLIPKSVDLEDGAVWTPKDLTAVVNAGQFVAVPPGDRPILAFLIEPNAVNTTHSIAALYDGKNPNTGTNGSRNLTLSAYFTAGSAGYNHEFKVSNASGSAKVAINNTTGAVQSSGVTGSFSGLSVSSASVNGATWRVVMTFRPSSMSSGLTFTWSALDATFSDTFVGNGDIAWAGGFTLEPGEAAGTAIRSPDAGTCSFFANGKTFPVPTGDVVPRAAPRGRDLVYFRREIGFLHAWHYYGAGLEASPDAPQAALKVWDNDNPAGYVDASVLLVARAWQPGRDFERDSLSIAWEEAPLVGDRYRARGRRFRRATVRLHYLTRDEALREWDRIAVEVGASGYVFVCLDADETEYGQQKAIYGHIENHEITIGGYDQTAKAEFYRLTVTIVERVP